MSYTYHNTYIAEGTGNDVDKIYYVLGTYCKDNENYFLRELQIVS